MYEGEGAGLSRFAGLFELVRATSRTTMTARRAARAAIPAARQSILLPPPHGPALETPMAVPGAWSRRTQGGRLRSLTSGASSHYEPPARLPSTSTY
jgi:hypothetical protein